MGKIFLQIVTQPMLLCKLQLFVDRINTSACNKFSRRLQKVDVVSTTLQHRIFLRAEGEARTTNNFATCNTTIVAR